MKRPALRVVLADDHALVRQGFRRILEDEPDIVVAGEAGGGAEAIELTQQLEPDVVVLDLGMPEINGLHAAIEIRRRRPRQPILILSMHSDPQYVRNAFDAGVNGYILKNAKETDLIAAVRAVAGGERFVSAELAAAPAGGSVPADPDDERFARLSAREIQVLRLIALGRTNKEIGVLLGVSANTVAVHRTNLMATLNVHKAAELVLFAVKRGLVSPP
jgi:DNA-binding NarL/FixJ family response regulator